MRHVFFKLTEFRAAAESPQHKRVQRTEAQPGPITGMLKLNSDMRRHRDSGNYERLFSITSLLTGSPARDVLIHRYKLVKYCPGN